MKLLTIGILLGALVSFIEMFDAILNIGFYDIITIRGTFDSVTSYRVFFPDVIISFLMGMAFLFLAYTSNKS